MEDSMRLRNILCGAALLLATGCDDDSDNPDTQQEPVHVSVATRQVQPADLISAATCEVVNGKLRRCAIAPRTVLPLDTESAVPVRTVARREISGNCATPYALEVRLTSTQLEGGATSYRFLSDKDVVLRAPGGVRLPDLTIADASPWTATAAFDASCLVKLVVSLNEPDVDTPEQASALVAQIDLDLVNARRELENYHQLLLFQGAHAFLLAVAGDLHAELSNDMMQRLRAAYLDAVDAFDQLDGATSCAQVLGGSLDRIRDVADALFILGDPSDWRNSDGSPRTLADMYREFRGDGVIAQIEALAAQSSPDLAAVYRDGYDAAALKVAQLNAKRALAVVQLAAWLEGDTP
jgi:hypothetical protein